MSEVQTVIADTPTVSADTPTSTPETTPKHEAPADLTPTQAVAAEALHHLESETAESDPEPAKPEATAASESESPADPDDLETIQPDYTDSMGRKRESRIPYKRVQRIVENKVRKAQAEWEANARQIFGLPADQPVDLGQIASRARGHEQTVQAMAEVERLMTNDPVEFITRAASLFPAWSDFLGEIRSAVSGRSERSDSQPTPRDMPQPDLRLSDGSYTYSQKGIEARMAWEREQAAKLAEDRILQQLRPFTDSVSQQQEQARQQAFLQQASQRIDQILKEAETWPGFKENEAEILKTLQGDSSISLERAYQKVVYPKLQTDRNKVREEVLKEINAQPRSTSAPATNTRSNSTKGDQSTLDHARAAYQKLGGS